MRGVAVRFSFRAQSLAGRATLALLAGLALVEALGLMLHTLDRRDLVFLGEARDVAVRAMGVYRPVVLAPEASRAALLAKLDLPPGTRAALGPTPPAELPPAPLTLARLVRAGMALAPIPPPLRPRDVVVLGTLAEGHVVVGLALPDGNWLTVTLRLPPTPLWRSPLLLAAFLALMAFAAGLVLWLVRVLVAPIATLAAAAERLGRDVNAPALAEDGPREIALAAAAFNRMAERIRRFVQDRTFLLTAIGHDLRTPITRLKLRAEFLDDEEMRAKILGDLDEMEAMLAATLAFGRDDVTREKAIVLDLAALLRTVLDEAADANPELTERLGYEGPERLGIRARPLALKRALGNLVANALKYGGAARIRLAPPAGGVVLIEIEDDGPGIPPSEQERVFEPFRRLEASRNRETGGSGLGLPIARNILRAHGGDVTLANRPGGGVRVTVSLPI